jgi:hypothetical protein
MPSVYCTVCGQEIKVRPQSMKTVDRDSATCGAGCFLSLLKRAKGELPRTVVRHIYDEGDPGYTVWSDILRMAFRSGKEKSFAEWMYNRGIPFKYEPYDIPIGTTIAVPDFWFSTWRTFVEVKGMWAPGGNGKFVALKEAYPEMRILLLSTHIGWNYGRIPTSRHE